MLGPLGEEPTRISMYKVMPLSEDVVRISTRPSHKDLTRSHFMSCTFCASLRHRNALGQITRAILGGNLPEKCRAPEISRTFCASLCQKRHMDIARASAKRSTWTCHRSHFMRKFTGKMPRPRSATQVLGEPAQSKRTWTTRKSHFMRKFKRKMPVPRVSTSIKQRP